MSVMPIKASSLANLRNTILYHALGSGITTKRHDLTQEIKFLLCNEDREADLSDDATMKAFDDYFYGLWYFNQAACVLRDKGVEVLPAYSSDTMRQLYEDEMERVRPQIQVVSLCQVLKTKEVFVLRGTSNMKTELYGRLTYLWGLAPLWASILCR